MRWTVGRRIAAGFALALAALLAIGIMFYRSTASLIDASDRRQQSYVTVQQLDEIFNLVLGAQRGERGFVITADERFLEPYNAFNAAIGQELRELRRLTADNPNHQQRLNALDPLITQQQEMYRRVLVLRREQGLEAAVQEVQSGRGDRLVAETRKLMQEMQSEEMALLKGRTDEASERARHAQLVVVYGTIAAFALMAVTGWLITVDISRPLKNICHVAEQLADGDMSADLQSNSRSDEIGTLSRAFNRMIQSLRGMADAAQLIAAGDLRASVTPQSEHDVLGKAFSSMTENLRSMTRELSEGVAVLASSASEILASTTQVASGSAQTAAAVSQTTATVEEVKQTIQVSTDKARSVSDTAQRTTQVSQGGRKAVEDSIASIDRIHEHMDSIAQSIVRLSEQSQAIGEIIATVKDFAEQSNLLAVNAAIEAAKAGEHGKGFSVVAQEVKSLAEQSRQATAQVRSILGDIEKATSAAVIAAEQGGKAVEAGVRLSGEAGESIRSVAESIETAARAAAQIAASAQQQAVGMDQVAQAMHNINHASAQNVASTQQTEKAAKNLHELGRRLQQLVDQYQT
jgi:methyl-accepting chemotaxis protein